MMRNSLAILLGLLSLACYIYETNCAVDHSKWLLLEGTTGVYYYGFISGNVAAGACSGAADRHWQKDSIQIAQVKNVEMEVEKRFFTLTYEGMTENFGVNEGFLAMNTYQGCMISIMFDDPEAGNYGTTVIQRTTYTIKAHQDFNNERKLEFQSISRIPKTFNVVDNSGFYAKGPPCGASQNYYWYHPYTTDNFHISGSRRITIINYHLQTDKSACSIDFDDTQTPTFHHAEMTNNIIPPASDNNENIMDRFVFVREFAFFVTKNTNSQYAIIRWEYLNTDRDSHTFTFTYHHSGSGDRTRNIQDLCALQNYGLVFVHAGLPGYFMLPVSALGAAGAVVNKETGDNWRLFQTRINENKQATIYGVKDSLKGSFYRITTDITLVYDGVTLTTNHNFYDNPTDFGIFHLMTIELGACDGEGDASRGKAIFIDLTSGLYEETCSPERNIHTVGNGFKDANEYCDDGDLITGDGCDLKGRVELPYRTFNHRTRSFLQRTLCGDGYYNPASPENEKCDDGGFSDVDTNGHYDGCTQDCQIILQGWHCGIPNVPCVHLCGNGVLDVRTQGPAYPVSSYPQEVCDEGAALQVGSQRCLNCYDIHPEFLCLTPNSQCEHRCGINGVDSVPGFYTEACDESLDPALHSSTVYQAKYPTYTELHGGGCTADCMTVNAGWTCPGGMGDGGGGTCAPIKICGNQVLESGEDCDDGGRDALDRCGGTCLWEYDDTCWNNYTLSGGTPCESKFTCCKSYYVYEESSSATHQNSKTKDPYEWKFDHAANKVCWRGKYCYDCTEPKWPGYPLRYHRLLTSGHNNYYLPDETRGRLRIIEYVLTDGSASPYFGFSVVTDHATYQWTNLPSSHNESVDFGSSSNIGIVRQTFGKYFFYYKQASDTPEIYGQALDGSDPADPNTFSWTQIIKTAGNYPPLAGNEFFIYWPSESLLLARQYNGKYWNIFKLDAETIKKTTSPTPSEDFESQINYFIDITGVLPLDAVFRAEFLYIYRELTDYSNSIGYYVSRYKYIGMGSTLLDKTWDIPNAVTSIVSFPDAIVWISNDLFYKENSGGAAGTTISADSYPESTATGWRFLQGRPSPEQPGPFAVRAINPSLAACSTCVYTVTYDDSTGKLTFLPDPSNPLPSDLIRNGWDFNAATNDWEIPTTGRFNFDYPFDIGQNLLINLGLHTCAGRSIYQWYEYYRISLNVYDFSTSTFSCHDFEIGLTHMDVDESVTVDRMGQKSEISGRTSCPHHTASDAPTMPAPPP